MTINKNTDLEFSLQKGTEKGGVYTNFYTEDKGSASIRIRLSSNEYYLDLTKTDLKPVLFLFHEDDSIFEIRDFINVMPDKGLIQYNLSDNVIAHAGKVKAKLFLKNTEQSVHVANFTFDIKDSGIEGAVEKEISVNIIDDAVRRIIEANPENYKGKDADPNDVKDLLIPYTEGRVTEEFERLSSAKQVDSEVINARNGKESLNQRLTESDDKVIDVKKQMNKELIGKRKRKPIMTFVDDDGRIENLEKWRQTVIDKKIPLSIALITSLIGKEKFLSLEQIYELKDMGVEFTNHTHDHILLGNFSEEAIRNDFEKSKSILNKYGLVDDILVYPGGSQSAMVREVAREYFRCAVSTAEAQNTPPLKTFSLNRKTLADTNYNTLEYYKQQVDDVVANNGWLIWKSHSHYEAFDSVQVGYIRELIDYAREKGVEIVGMSEGLDIYGNIIDTGDYVSSSTGADYTILDNQGILHSKTNSKDFRYIWNLGSVSTTPINSYQTGKTLEMILSPQATGFPKNKGGTLETYKLAQDYYSYQIYNIWDTTEVYKRVWNRKALDWGSWNRIDATRLNEQIQASVNSDIPANGFKEISVTNVVVSNNDNIIVTPRAGLEPGLMYVSFIGGTNNIRIRLFNMTSKVISVSRSFKIDIIKQ